jgi:hypothetical protein
LRRCRERRYLCPRPGRQQDSRVGQEISSPNNGYSVSVFREPPVEFALRWRLTKFT